MLSIKMMREICGEGAVDMNSVLNNFHLVNNPENVISMIRAVTTQPLPYFKWAINKDGIIVCVSSAIKRVIGFRPGDFIGQHFNFRRPQGNRSQSMDKFNQILSFKKPIINLYNHTYDVDGKIVPVFQNAFPLYNNKGDVVGLAGFSIRDKKGKI